MAVDPIVAGLGAVQIIVQLVAVYFSYVIYKYNRLNKAWLAITLALILMTIRRITASAIEFGAFANLSGPLQFVDRVGLPSLISILLLLGLWSMKNQFESFDVIEKNVKYKISQLAKGPKKQTR